MVIHKVNSEEDKGDQHYEIVFDCRKHWSRLNNTNYSDYSDIMNMKTLRWNDRHWCYVALTYHFNLNKW